MKSSLDLSFSLVDSPFLTRWNRLFGIRSATASFALDRLCRLFSQKAFLSSFAFWRSIGRATSNFAQRDAESDGWTKIFSSLEPNARPDVEKETFVLQTYAAQSFFSILSASFQLSNVALRELFGATPFDWGESIRENVAAQASELAPFAEREFAPFGECYPRLFSAKRRRTLGEFYTPSALADYLRDRAFDFFRETQEKANEFPSVLDPTCGGGVFLTSVLKRRFQENVAPETALDDLAGFDASPIAVLTARANLIFAATSGVASEERPAALRRIVEQRRAKRPNATIFPIFLLDSVQNRVPTPPLDEPNVPPNVDPAPDYFDSRRWERSLDFSRRFDVVLGNPPWIAWDKLAPEYRAATKKYWREYGLFSLSGKEARFGGGKKESASLLVCATLDRRLVSGGVLAFVLPKSLFQTRKAGDGFRRFGWNSTDFRVLQIDDFSEIDVFPNVLSKVATFCVRKGEKTRFPLPVRRWNPVEPTSAVDSFASVSADQKKRGRTIAARADVGRAEPISPQPGAPLRFEVETALAPNADAQTPDKSPLGVVVPSARADAELVAKILAQNENRRPSDYVAKLGANAAGASGVFWLEKVENLSEPFVTIRNLGDVGRKKVATVAARVESTLVFPLLRWRDVDEFAARTPDSAILLPQNPQTRRGLDEETMRRDFPATFEYLTQFENELRNRAAHRKLQQRAPFWSLYNVDVGTFAPLKVVWRRMDSTLRAAVVEFNVLLNRPTIPQETLASVVVESLDEADYLAAFLNSEPIRRRVAASSVPGSKSFGSPGILETLGVPRFDPNDADRRALAEFGRREREKRRGKTTA